MPPFRILVADDQEAIRCVVAGILSSRAGWEVCCEAANGKAAIEKTAELKPDIVLLDSAMPDLSGFETASTIVQADPSQKVLILTSDATEQIARNVFDSGALGFVVKANAIRELVPAIEALRQGRTRFTSRMAELILNGYLKGGAREELEKSLSDRERATLKLLAKEFSNGPSESENRRRTRRTPTAFAVAALVIAFLVLGWTLYGAKLQEVRAMEQLFVTLRLKPPPPPPAANYGNPDVKVWVDLHTALYYCPDAGPYGKTVKGRFTNQRTAQLEHFESASGKPCE